MMRSALGRLKVGYRQVLELRYFRELSYHEIAVVIGITPTNAGVRITRALAQLKEHSLLNSLMTRMFLRQTCRWLAAAVIKLAVPPSYRVSKGGTLRDQLDHTRIVTACSPRYGEQELGSRCPHRSRAIGASALAPGLPSALAT